jgi:hypothetical protein
VQYHRNPAEFNDVRGNGCVVMAGHSRLKDGVASARLCPAIHVFLATTYKDVDARQQGRA